MAVAAGNILRCACRQTFDIVEDLVNVLHLVVVTPPTPNDDASLLEDIGQFIGQAWSNIEAELSTSVDAADITVYNVSGDRPVGVGSWGVYTGGTGTGDYLPPTDALMVLLATGLKRRQGRIYFGGFTEAQQNAGFWTAGAASAAATVVADLITLGTMANGGQFQMQVYSRIDGDAYEVQTVRAERNVAVMKSRKRGRGS